MQTFEARCIKCCMHKTLKGVLRNKNACGFCIPQITHTHNVRVIMDFKLQTLRTRSFFIFIIFFIKNTLDYLRMTIICKFSV